MKQKPIGNAAPDILRPFDVSVHHYGKYAAGEMARVIPACELDLFGELGVLALVRVGSGLPPSAQTSRSIMGLSGEET